MYYTCGARKKFRRHRRAAALFARVRDLHYTVTVPRAFANDLRGHRPVVRVFQLLSAATGLRRTSGRIKPPIEKMGVLRQSSPDGARMLYTLVGENQSC